MDTKEYSTVLEQFRIIRNTMPSFFSLSGYPKKSFQLHNLQIFEIYSHGLWAKINRTEKKYNLLSLDESAKFIAELREQEIPRFVGKDLLQDSLNNRHVIESYLGDNDEENIQEILSSTNLLKLCILICDHWRYIELTRIPLFIEKDTEIDELEDFRELANMVGAYVNTQVPEGKGYKTFSSPEYVFV